MGKVILFDKNEDCCGCWACYSICPTKAISMEADKYGFIYPKIDYERCIGCLQCKKVCSFQNCKEDNVPIKSFVATSKNTNIKESASGGVFSSMSISTLKSAGVVFGVSMEKTNNAFYPMHEKVKDVSDLCRLQGSKYVQSSINDSFIDVRNELEKNTRVLFSGTPCQIAGLRAFLKKDYENLLCIDIVCHGVPNAQFFRDYLVEYEKELCGDIVQFNFRDKTRGWGLYAKINYQIDNGKIHSRIINAEDSSYYQLFLESRTYRESCYKCKYASQNRPGDLTIGDFWGIEIEHPEYVTENKGFIEVKKGVSCLIVNTPKGQQYLEQYGEGLNLYDTTFNKVAKHNNQLRSPSVQSIDRNEILEIYKLHGYAGVEKWFKGNLGTKQKLKLYVRTIIRNISGTR